MFLNHDDDHITKAYFIIFGKPPKYFFNPRPTKRGWLPLPPPPPNDCSRSLQSANQCGLMLLRNCLFTVALILR